MCQSNDPLVHSKTFSNNGLQGKAMQILIIKRWLIVCCCMVVVMIFLGGVTRLTDSGLSIVEWKPVTGIIPPFNNSSWQSEFVKYQNFPEYQQRNIDMSLSEFKFIFWLEFIHRLAGRITGLLYLIPLLYFFIKGKINRSSVFVYLTILILFFVQGFIGWYMVKSGLILHPYVSHFRLGCHLIIAVIIYNLLFCQLMLGSFDILLISHGLKLSSQKFFCLLSLILIYMQILLGALVAGLDGGLVYNSFPLMGNNFIPKEVTFDSLNIQSFNDPVFVQFIHRIGAYMVSISIILLGNSLVKLAHPKLKRVACAILLVLGLQILSGIIVVLYSVPISIALLHQIFAIILLSCISWCYFLLDVNIELPTRLDRYLKIFYPSLTQGIIERSLRLRKIRVNSCKIEASFRVKAGDKIFIDSSLNLAVSTGKLLNDYLIYQDDYFIAIDKPAGLAVQSGSKIRLSIDDALQYLNSLGTEFKLVHRLDKDTSGILLIAKNYLSSIKMMRAFQEKIIQKTYLAVGLGKLQKNEGEISGMIGKKRGRGYEIVENDEEGGKFAITYYKLLKVLRTSADNNSNISLLEFTPLTGRMHQLRFHAKMLNCPILGDVKYGTAESITLSKKMLLHAQKIMLPKQIFGKEIIIETKLPSYFNLNSI
ncbi:Heme A synthase, partial [Pseudolycoriella hygida]